MLNKVFGHTVIHSVLDGKVMLPESLPTPSAVFVKYPTAL
jgi:hypothetical protein